VDAARNATICIIQLPELIVARSAVAPDSGNNSSSRMSASGDVDKPGWYTPAPGRGR